MNKKTPVLVTFTAALLMSGAAARADVEINSKPTANMSCDSGVCTATAQKAVLNVADLANMLASGDVAVKTGSLAKDIVIDQPLQWTSTSRLTLDAQRSIVVKKAVTVAGTAGLTLSTNDGGSGGDLLFENKGSVTFWDTGSSLVINGQSYTLVQDIATLAADIAADPSGFYALANSYDARRDHFRKVPIPTSFSGILEGLGQTIAHLTIRHSTKCKIEKGSGLLCEGFFASISADGTVRDIKLRRATVYSSDADYAGALVGQNYGTIQHLFVDGTVQGTAADMGGLVGDNGGRIVGASSGATVIGSASGGVGGLVGGTGGNFGVVALSSADGPVSGGSATGGLVGSGSNIDQSYARGPVSGNHAVGGLTGVGSQIDQCYATGTVTGGDDTWVGGLIGAGDHISNSYATGQVQAGHKSSIGGLVGYGDTINDSYSTGAATSKGRSRIGGFVGKNIGHQSAEDYWDLDTSEISVGCGKGDCSGVTGLTTQEFQSGLPSGFPLKIWGQDVSINGGFPYLLAIPPN